MQDFLSQEWWLEQWATLWTWVETELFIWPSALQIALILASFGAAKLLAAHFDKWLKRKIENLETDFRLRGIFRALETVTSPMIWLALIWTAGLVADAADFPQSFLRITESLLFLWVVIRLAARLIRNRAVSHFVTIAAWAVAALNIVGLLDPALRFLDGLALNLGQARISLLLVIKALLVLVLLLWLALLLSRLGERSIRSAESFTPSVQELLSKLLRIALITLSFLLALNLVGIDLTALTIFGGALGVGLGFGMQKIVANFISGLILLLDRSIKPGDVIAIDDTFGWINHLGIRYTSVITRDGTEHLIPNELLITERVENWSHSNDQVRFKIPVGVAYHSDIFQARQLCIDAAKETERILESPVPVCHLIGFGDSSVDLEIRVWIQDPVRGVTNVLSEVRLNVWQKFREHGVDIPFPQRDLHLRSITDEASGTLGS